MLSLPALASDPGQGLLECLDQSDPELRLACYDRLAERARDAPPAPDLQDQGIPGNNASPASTAGTAFPGPVAAQLSEPASISSRISKVARTARGHRVVVLENGQTWIEVEVGRQPIEAGQTVTVNKRRWRYVMQLEGMPDVGVRRAE